MAFQVAFKEEEEQALIKLECICVVVVVLWVYNLCIQKRYCETKRIINAGCNFCTEKFSIKSSIFELTQRK